MSTILRLAFLFGAFSAMGSSTAFANAALAIDHNQGAAYGTSFDERSMRRAERVALRDCGLDCEIVLRIETGCGAYAADQARDSTVFGYAFAEAGESERAQRRAMRQCREHGGRRCQVRAWACNSY